MKIAAFFAILALVPLLASPFAGAAPIRPLVVLNSRPHPADSYTQGLFFHDGQLYESSGLYGRSALTKRPFAPDRPAEMIRRRPLPDSCFAEGAALAEGEIYLLTWLEERGFVLDPATLAVKREFAYAGEGWGLAWDGTRLWRSDGSARLYPHRAGDFAPAGEPLTVRDEGRETPHLNELEWDPQTGLMLANVYGSDMVAAVDLADGRIRFWLDARPLRELARKEGLPDTGQPLDVALNGLALDGRSLWLTGKFWPRLYQAAWPPEEAPAGRRPAQAGERGK